MKDINNTIDEAIMALADESISVGAEVLLQLATTWAKAGLPQESFQDIRQYIINEASDKTDALFIAEKLKIAEQAARTKRLFMH